jgi:hypothetical protein
MRQQSRLTTGQPSSAHTTTRTTYPGSGSEAAPRFRHRIAPLAALAVFTGLTAAMATPGGSGESLAHAFVQLGLVLVKEPETHCLHA